MRCYRLEEKVKMLINHHFDILLYKIPKYIQLFNVVVKLKCLLCRYRFLQMCLSSITKTNSNYLI